jgi:hypothetical protein
MTASLRRFVKPRATTTGRYSLHVMGCTNVCMWMWMCMCVCGALQLEDECVAAAEKTSGVGAQHDLSRPADTHAHWLQLTNTLAQHVVAALVVTRRPCVRRWNAREWTSCSSIAPLCAQPSPPWRRGRQLMTDRAAGGKGGGPGIWWGGRQLSVASKW